MNPASASPDPVPSLGLTWGIKRSFIDYIAGLPDGSVSAAAGATVLEPGLFCFAPDHSVNAEAPAQEQEQAPAGSGSRSGSGSGYDAVRGTGVLRFRGDVRLAGHHGMLLVRLLDPWLAFTGGSGVLSISSGGGTRDRITVAFVRADAPREVAGSLVWEHVDVVISPEGSELFDGQYAAGQSMDPLVIRVAD